MTFFFFFSDTYKYELGTLEMFSFLRYLSTKLAQYGFVQMSLSTLKYLEKVHLTIMIVS